MGTNPWFYQPDWMNFDNYSKENVFVHNKSVSYSFEKKINKKGNKTFWVKALSPNGYDFGILPDWLDRFQ